MTERISAKERAGVQVCICADYRRDHPNDGACGFHDGCFVFQPREGSINCGEAFRERGIVHACGHLKDHDGEHGHRSQEEYRQVWERYIRSPAPLDGEGGEG